MEKLNKIISLKEFGADYVNYKMNNVKFKNIVINITAKCNLDCIFCECRSLDTKSDLTFNEIESFFREMADRGVKSVFIGGGEPFMRKDMWDILTLLKNIGYTISTVSNGLLLADVSEKKLNIFDQTISALFLSLDSTKPTLHNYYRDNKQAYDKVVKTIDRFVDLPNTKLIITMVITNENYKEMPDMIDFAKDYGVKCVNFQPFSDSTNYPDVPPKDKTHLLLHPDKVDELKSFYDAAILRAKKLNIESNLELTEPWIFNYFSHKSKKSTIFHHMVNHFDCVVPFDDLYVRHNGDIQICALLPKISSIREKSIEEAINDIKRNRNMLKKGKFPPECRRCFCGLNRNVRFSILSHPIKNWSHFKKLLLPDKNKSN